MKPKNKKQTKKLPKTKPIKTALAPKQQQIQPQIKLYNKTITINGQEFPVKTVSPVLVANLKETLNKTKITILEVAPGETAKVDLIKHMVLPEAVPFMRAQSRFYYIDYLQQRINGLRRYFIRDIGQTFGEIVDRLLANGVKVFLHGGIIRDFFTHTRSTDIDIIFDVSVSNIKKICDAEGWPCAQVMVLEQYINFGTEKGISLEGSNMRNSFCAAIHHHETSVNDFSYDMGNNILVDFSGYGLVDVIARRIRITPLPKYWSKWASEDFKKPLRFFKLIQKGFTPANPATLDFVINYIRDNFETIYEAKFSVRYPVSRIKHFLIKNITMGEIDPATGVYSFGPNEDKLMPFLRTIKQYVGRPIFIQMLAHFTLEDLQRFKNARVISTLRNYLSSQEVVDAHAELDNRSGGFF